MATVTTAGLSTVRSPEAQRIYDRLKAKHDKVDAVMDVADSCAKLIGSVTKVVEPVAGHTAALIGSCCGIDSEKSKACAETCLKVSGSLQAPVENCLNATRKVAHTVVDRCC